MQSISLQTMEERSNGFTHLWKITYADLNDTAGLTKTLQLMGTAQNGVAVGDLVRDAALYLRTAFVGTAVTNLAIDVGYDLAAGTDDPDAFLDNYELAGVATEVLAADGNGAVFATLRTGYAFQEAGDIEALFTAVGANLSALTAGEVWVFLAIARLPKLGGV
jgi:hypothetical protein